MFKLRRGDMSDQIKSIIAKDDLGDPYGSLIDILDLSDIIKVEAEFGGRYVTFKKILKEEGETYNSLLVLIGKEKTIKVLRRMGGTAAYFPRFRSSAANKIKATIQAEFNGGNYVYLSKKYGYSERHIRRIVSGRRGNRPPHEDQLTFW